MIVDNYLVGTPEEQAFYAKTGAVSNGLLVVTAAGRRVGPVDGSAGLAKSLAEYRRLPEADRKPRLPNALGREDPDKMPPSPPEGGLTLIVYNTQLERTPDGRLVRARNLPAPGPSWTLESPLTLNDLLWLTRGEWQALMPENPQPGQTGRVPDSAQRRLFRFSGYDWFNGHGDTTLWPLRAGDLTWTVEGVSAGEIRLRLQGFSEVGLSREASRTAKISPKAPDDFGADLNYLGWVTFDRAKKAIVEFRMAALGETWTKWNRATEKNDEGLHFYPTGLVVELASTCSANRTGWPNMAAHRHRHAGINYWDPGK